MRAFQGQHSDNRTIRRTPEHMKAALVRLRTDLTNLPSRATPGMREQLVKRIQELELEIANAPPPSAPRAKRA
jgi:hypothetical protein